MTDNPSPRLHGRTAIVTGAARGIGAATAVRLSREGANVVVSDLDARHCADVVATIRGNGGRAMALSCDVRDRDEVEAAVSQTVGDFGSLDVLVCNAGVIRDNLVFKMADEDWMTVIDTHLKGAFLCVRAAQQHMVKNRYGKIVLLSSTSALGNRGQVNYAAAKAGIQGMASTLAIELGPFNINVNAVAPGFVETEMTRATADRAGMSFEEFKEAAVGRIPLGRGGTPTDIANVIAFFASDDSSYVSGQTLYVNGGRR